MRLPGEIAEHMRAHARWAHPIEACGLFAASSERVEFFYACTNIDQSPDRFTVDPAEQYRAMAHAEANGWQIGGSFHSHPGGHLTPSATDIDSALDPEWMYLIGSDQDVRGFRIASGTVREVSLRR